MNIGLHKSPKLSTLITTAYFVGMLISACVLYMLQFDMSQHALWITYRIVGVTMFIGIISIYYTARSRNERVVYLERKKEETGSSGATNEDVKSVIDHEAIRRIIDSGERVPQRVLNEICNRVGAGIGAIYANVNGSLELKYGYALEKNMSLSYSFGEGLVGRVAAEGKRLYLDQLPEGYITVVSGLGNSSPKRLALVPVKGENRLAGVMEIATFSDLNESTLAHLEESAEAIASTIY